MIREASGTEISTIPSLLPLLPLASMHMANVAHHVKAVRGFVYIHYPHEMGVVNIS